MRTIYNINELLELTKSNDNDLVRLGKKLIHHTRDVSDLDAQSMAEYIKEALYKYSDTKYLLKQYEKVGKIPIDDAIKEIARAEVAYYIKLFKKMRVKITSEELTNLVVAKMNHEGVK